MLSCLLTTCRFVMDRSVALSTNIITFAVILNHSVPLVFKPGITAPMISLQNALACRVFRLLKLELHKTSPNVFRLSEPSAHDHNLTSIQFNSPINTSGDVSVLTAPGRENK